MAFKIGDIVFLKSGSPAMSITEIHEPFRTEKNSYRVAWFAGKKHETGVFPHDALTATDPSVKK